MTTEELKALRSRVLDAINRELQPTRMNDEELLKAITALVEREGRGGYLLPIQKMDTVNGIYKMYRGLGGLLDSILADENVTEVMINGPDNIFVERSGRLTRVDKHFKDEQELRRVIDLIVGKAHREVSEANPIVDTRLEDGSRVNVVLSPIALSGSTITIRKFSKQPMTMSKLLEYGSITPEVANFLKKLVAARYNIFIAGGTGSGKTTFLNALSNYIPHDERIITIEDSAELQITQIPNIVRLETRNATASSGESKKIDIQTKKNMDSVLVEQMHFIKGNCYIELKDYANAVRELQTAVSTQGASTDSYRSFAIALANDGKMKEAQSTLETLQERGASSGDCDLVAAEIKSLQKQNSEALALYEKVLDEVTDPQLLSHAYLAAARTALNMEDTAYAERILERSCQALPESQTVLEKEMLVDIQLQQAAADKQNAEQNYKKAEQLLRELVESGYATISTKLNLATVLQALNQYQEADDILTELAQQYPLDYRFDMQRAYLLIDWQGTKPAEKREYQLADDCYESAVQKYRQAQANGTEDAQMTVLKNLIDQLYTSGWLK